MLTPHSVGTTNEEEVPALTIDEVKDVIKQLKNNKSAEKEDIGAVFIMMGPEKLVTCLHWLICRKLPGRLRIGRIRLSTDYVAS